MVIILHGKDSFRSLAELGSIEKKYEKAHHGANFFKFDCGDRVPSFSELESVCGTQSLFKETTLIVIKELFAETAYEDLFITFLKSSGVADAKDAVVVLWERIPLKAPLLKKLALGKIYNFEPLAGAKLHAWVESRVKGEGGAVTRGALMMLLERCGDDTGRLAHEIKKLVSYNSKITEESVTMLVPSVFEGDVFKMLDALAEGARARAFRIFETLLRGGEAELKLLAMLAFEVRGLLKVKTMPPGSKDSSMHPFVHKKLSRVVGRFSEEKLKMLYAMLHAADRSIKTGTPSPTMLLTRVLCSF